MPKGPARKKISPKVEKDIFVHSRRRCAICYGLKRDLSEKQGQIAHLDSDRSNNAEDNLVFLCFDHHNAYDSKTSQAKNFTEAEVKHYRQELYEFIKNYGIDNSQKQTENLLSQLQHDVQVFKKADGLLSEQELLSILEEIHVSASYRDSSMQRLRKQLEFHQYASNAFLNTVVAASTTCFSDALIALFVFLKRHFRTESFEQEVSEWIYVMEPALKNR